jgi:hypothetical protein
VLLALPFCGSGRPSIWGLIALLRTLKSLAVALMVIAGIAVAGIAVAGIAVAGIQPAQAAAQAQAAAPASSFSTMLLAGRGWLAKRG